MITEIMMSHTISPKPINWSFWVIRSSSDLVTEKYPNISLFALIALVIVRLSKSQISSSSVAGVADSPVRFAKTNGCLFESFEREAFLINGLYESDVMISLAVTESSKRRVGVRVSR